MASETNTTAEQPVPTVPDKVTATNVANIDPVFQSVLRISTIPLGTVLCDKYTVVKEFPVMGRYASLFLCEAGEEKYVAKLYRRNNTIKEDVANALKAIDSPFVAKLYDFGVYNGFPFEILPYYEHGNVQGCTFSFEELKEKIIPSLNEALHVLHKNKILHKNLKPSNIMLCDNEEDVAIIDFGISAINDVHNTIIITQTGVSAEYASAETFRNLFLEESDYYSLGITLYELYTGKTPYGNLTTEEIARYVSKQQIPFPSNMPKELCNLIAGLTYNDISNRKNKSNPNRRWTYKEVRNWCREIPQPIPGENGEITEPQIPAYAFKKQKYTTLPALAEALAENWEDGKKQLFRGLLSAFFKSIDPEIAGYCIDAEKALAKGGNEDQVFFKTLYAIHPDTKTFYWRGVQFENLTDLGNDMLAHLRMHDASQYEFYDEIISKHIVSSYVAINDAGNDKLLSAVKIFEDRLIQKQNDAREKVLAYYLVAFALSGRRTLALDGITAITVDELVAQLQAALKASEKRFQRVCDQLINDKGILNEQFEAWLIACGKAEEIVKWRREYGT